MRHTQQFFASERLTNASKTTTNAYKSNMKLVSNRIKL